MWVLDPTNSGELIDRLRPHALSPDFEVVWCGEGWKVLVGECHDELLAAFPEYCFGAIKQKWGGLSYQARPRAGEATPEEVRLVHEITDKYRQASETVCERCGRPGSLRTDLTPVWLSGSGLDLTLCDYCTGSIGTTSQPRPTPTA